MSNSWIILALTALFGTAQCAQLNVLRRALRQADPNDNVCAKAYRDASKAWSPVQPDPDNCKKFFSCQKLVEGWRAHPMDCPAGTAFDPQLNTCNFFGKVQACKGSYFTSDESMTWSQAKKVKSIICLKSIIDDLTTGYGSVK